LGYPLEQWSEKSFWANHIHPDDRSWVIDLCAGYTRVKKEHQFEYRMIANDGRTVWLADFVTVVVEKNKPVQLRGIMVDITARKKAEEELHERNSQLKQLSKHLQNVREEERKYLAREVHDELGQLAAVVKMDIDWLQIKMPDVESAPKKRIEHALSTTNLLINTIRKIASDLRPGMLDELGLNASLECECEKFKAANGIDCVFESTIDDSRVGSQAKTELYRICQESLHNVLRHAEASHITVSLNEGSGTIEMHIRDNGKGFDTQAKTTNHGLMGIAERSFSINGILNISSVIGKGTVVSIIIPKSN
jgi:PAS domain S-box-containing protein